MPLSFKKIPIHMIFNTYLRRGKVAYMGLLLKQDIIRNILYFYANILDIGCIIM